MSYLPQIIGTVMIALLGASGLYVVADLFRFRSYGRDVLRTFAVMQFWFVFGRLAHITGWWDASTTVMWAGLGAGVTLAIVTNLIAMHEFEHRAHTATEEGVRT